MTNTTFDDRVIEIHNHVANDDLNLATLRLMDFVTDFALERKWRSEVTVLRGTYVELKGDIRIQGKSRETDIRTRELRRQILSILDELIDESSVVHTELTTSSFKEVAESKKIKNQISNSYSETKTSSYEVAKKIFIQERNQLSRSTNNIVFVGKDIRKTYTSESIIFTLKQMDLELRLGEINAVVGENGSGKTTLLEIVAGRLKASEGEITYPLLTLDNQIDAYAIRSQIAYIPQSLPSWPGSLVETLHFSAASHGIRGQENSDEVEFIIRRLGLEKYRQAKWHELSGGFKTRFALAKVLIWHPKLVVLDEPLANLDINTQLLFLQDLRYLTSSVAYPMAVILSSQHLHRVEDIADNIIFLRDGQTIYNGSIAMFGEDRAENLFELACDLHKNTLMDFLEKKGYTRINGANHQFFIHTPRDVTASDILKILVENHVSIRYFRNLSKSTRRLFEDES